MDQICGHSLAICSAFQATYETAPFLGHSRCYFWSFKRFLVFIIVIQQAFLNEFEPKKARQMQTPDGGAHALCLLCMSPMPDRAKFGSKILTLLI
jgi:hypothetical protein